MNRLGRRLGLAHRAGAHRAEPVEEVGLEAGEWVVALLAATAFRRGRSRIKSGVGLAKQISERACMCVELIPCRSGEAELGDPLGAVVLKQPLPELQLPNGAEVIERSDEVERAASRWRGRRRGGLSKTQPVDVSLNVGVVLVIEE
jgi:hypothetical protein